MCFKGGCIIRAKFLDFIKAAYERDPQLANLLIDSEFSKDLVNRHQNWRKVINMAIQ